MPPASLSLNSFSRAPTPPLVLSTPDLTLVAAVVVRAAQQVAATQAGQVAEDLAGTRRQPGRYTEVDPTGTQREAHGLEARTEGSA
jgi:hypothetical protein